MTSAAARYAAITNGVERLVNEHAENGRVGAAREVPEQQGGLPMSLQEPQPRYRLSLWKGRLDAPSYASMSGRQIIETVAALYGLTGADLCRRPTGRGAHADAWPRQHAMWALRQERHPRRPTQARWSATQIAKMFWPTMDRTTATHGIQAHARRAMQ